MTAQSDSIFRKAALDRLASPEQLDQIASLPSPLGWLALVALASILAAALAWSCLGSVPTWVEGDGILITAGGRLFDAMAPAEGTVLSVAEVGTRVRKDQLVATLDDTRLRQELAHAQAVVAEKQADRAQISERYAQQLALMQKNVAEQKANLQHIVEAAQQSSAFYAKLLKDEQAYAAQGYLRPLELQETRQKLEQADQQARASRADMLKLDADALALQNRRDQDVEQAERAIAEARRQADALATQIGEGTRVVSPLDGVVTEIKATPGTVVAAGKALVSIEAAGEALELLLYLPPEYGKTVAPGMDVRIAPATVRREEYGTLIGRVAAISDFPMTSEGMLNVLQNQQLVAAFSRRGPPFQAVVELLPGAGVSGYRWSSGAGPPLKLSSGTTASAEITVRRQAPISLLLPVLRDTGGATR